MKRIDVSDSIHVLHCDNYIAVSFDSPHRALSSAVFNGGSAEVNHILNLQVPIQTDTLETPTYTLDKYCTALGLRGTVIGMMTAASMNSFRIETESIQDTHISVLVTCGLGNTMTAGDYADYRDLNAVPTEVGTINTLVLTSAQLTEAAMAEAIMIATEAKTVALREAGIKSYTSQKIATGTGTDAIAIVSGHGPASIEYCGKHVVFGEILGRLVIKALLSSIHGSKKVNP